MFGVEMHINAHWELPPNALPNTEVLLCRVRVWGLAVIEYQQEQRYCSDLWRRIWPWDAASGRRATQRAGWLIRLKNMDPEGWSCDKHIDSRHLLDSISPSFSPHPYSSRHMPHFIHLPVLYMSLQAFQFALLSLYIWNLSTARLHLTH